MTIKFAFVEWDGASETRACMLVYVNLLISCEYLIHDLHLILLLETGYKALHNRYKIEADGCIGKT